MEYTCELCNYKSEDKSNYGKHLKTSKHIAKETGEKKQPKEYICETCKHSCFDRSNFSKHKASLAHKIKTGEVEKVIKKHKCAFCDHETKDWSNLYKHMEIHPEINIDKLRQKLGRLRTDYQHMTNNILYPEYNKKDKEGMKKLIEENRKKYDELCKIDYNALIEKQKEKEERKLSKEKGIKKVIKKSKIKLDDNDSIDDKQPVKLYKYYKTDQILDDNLTKSFKAGKLQSKDYYMKYLQYIENKMNLSNDSLTNWVGDTNIDKMDERTLNELVDEAFDALEDDQEDDQEDDF